MKNEKQALLLRAVDALTEVQNLYPKGPIPLIAQFGRAYYAELWDSVRDDLPDGLDDDLLVLDQVFSLLETLDPAMQSDSNEAYYNETTRKLADEVRLLRKSNSHLLRVLNRFLKPNRELQKEPKLYFRHAFNRIRATTVRLLDQANPGDSAFVDWIIELPAIPLTRGTATIGLFGPTSCGKTTLIRRLITHWSKGMYASYLPATPKAHTTCIPTVIDFDLNTNLARWSLNTVSTIRSGILPRVEVDEEARIYIENKITSTSETSTGFLQFIFPTNVEKRVRLIDLPGTHGFAGGDWGKRAKTLALGLDAIIIPADRRYFSLDTSDCVFAGLENFPVGRQGIALRYVPPKIAKTKTPSWYKAQRVSQAIRSRITGTSDLNVHPKTFNNRFSAMPLFEFAKDSESEDSINDLALWILATNPKRHRPPSYLDIERYKSNGNIKSEIVDGLLANVGVLRALRACL